MIRHALGGASGIGQFVHLQLVDAPAVGEDEQPVVAVSRQDVLDRVLIAHLDARHAPTATTLGAEHLIAAALDVAAIGQRDQNIDFGDQTPRDSTRDVLDARAALVSELLLEVLQILSDDAEDEASVTQQSLQAEDLGEDPFSSSSIFLRSRPARRARRISRMAVA